jgi:hypothetical protein
MQNHLIAQTRYDHVWSTENFKTSGFKLIEPHG